MRILVSALILVSSSLSAQSWFPNEAVWHYHYYSLFGDQGYVRICVSGDTVINGLPCKELIKTRESSYQWNEPITVTIGSEFAYEENGLVMIYDPAILSFDTLYDMKADPGDRWQLVALPALACNPTSYMFVSDTGTFPIDGVPLRWLAVELHYYTGETTPISIVVDTIIDRIGILYTYFLPMDLCAGMVDWNEGGPFRCYTDNQVSYNIAEEIPCDLVTGIDDPISNSPSLIRQTTDRTIQIHLPDDRSAQLQMLDSRGRLLSTATIANGTSMDLSNLSSGIYLFKSEFMNGRIHSQKILLE